VDLATLTGACVIALGEEIAGLWSNSVGVQVFQAGRLCDTSGANWQPVGCLRSRTTSYGWAGTKRN